MTNVRLAELSAITRRSGQTIQNMSNARELPWPSDEFEGSGHRRFNGRHALALIVLEMLTKFGARMGDASDTVRGSWRMIERFTDDIEAGRDPGARFVASLTIAENHSVLGPRVSGVMIAHTGTADELIPALRYEMDSAGKESDRGNGVTLRHLGVASFITANLSEAYRLLSIRAASLGFEVRGPAIIRMTDQGADE